MENNENNNLSELDQLKAQYETLKQQEHYNVSVGCHFWSIRNQIVVWQQSFVKSVLGRIYVHLLGH